MDKATEEKTSPAGVQGSVLQKAEALEWLGQMLLIRRFEERAEEAYGQGKIGGFLHLYIGEEAIGVGAMAGLNADDDVVTHYRDHGYVLARGVDPGAVMAELFGKETGMCGGKGGSMHLADVSRHLWGGYAIVGGHIPLAVGLALAIQYQGGARVVCTIFGEGATNIGAFHTSLNMAAVWKLPVIFLVENNRYGMGTAVVRASAVSDIYQKACAYGIPAVQIDGNDVLVVRDAMAAAAAAARAGEGPQLIEALTYRFRGHSMGDPQRYRTRAEVDEMRARDPIHLLERRILAAAFASETDIQRMRAEVETVVDDAVRFADESPAPAVSAMYANVLVSE